MLGRARRARGDDMEKTERKVYVCFYAASIFVDLYARMYNHILTVAADGHDCESEHAAELGMILLIIWWKYCKPKQSVGKALTSSNMEHDRAVELITEN